MTQGDLAAYWGAVAQIIPVLALAFVIEARVIVRRLSKKQAFKYRGQRIRTSILLFVTAFLLTVSELAALQNLSSDPDRELSVLGHVYYWGSYVAVAVSLMLVVWFPISSMVSASTTDAFRWLEVHVPWGKARRFRRHVLRQIERIDTTLRTMRSIRLEALQLSGRALLTKDLDVEFVQRILISALDAEKHIGFLDPTGELRRLARSNPYEYLWVYRVSRLFYEFLIAGDRNMRKLRKEFRRQLRRIDKLTRVDTREFVKLQRANMAASARMP